MTASIEHIVSDPDIVFGKPRIAGTRFSVKDVVGHHLYNGIPLEVIASKWKLPLSGVYAAIAYYYDHQKEIDSSFADDDEFVRSMEKSNPSLLKDVRTKAGYDA